MSSLVVVVVGNGSASGLDVSSSAGGVRSRLRSRLLSRRRRHRRRPRRWRRAVRRGKRDCDCWEVHVLVYAVTTVVAAQFDAVAPCKLTDGALRFEVRAKCSARRRRPSSVVDGTRKYVYVVCLRLHFFSFLLLLFVLIASFDVSLLVSFRLTQGLTAQYPKQRTEEKICKCICICKC